MQYFSQYNDFTEPEDYSPMKGLLDEAPEFHVPTHYFVTYKSLWPLSTSPTKYAIQNIHVS
jgi:hypothetical protein